MFDLYFAKYIHNDFRTLGTTLFISMKKVRELSNRVKCYGCDKWLDKKYMYFSRTVYFYFCHACYLVESVSKDGAGGNNRKLF